MSKGKGKNKPQSASAMLLHAAAVAEMVGMSEASIYRMLGAGEFPEPIRFGKRLTRWKREEVERWVAALKP